MSVLLETCHACLSLSRQRFKPVQAWRVLGDGVARAATVKRQDSALYDRRQCSIVEREADQLSPDARQGQACTCGTPDFCQRFRGHVIISDETYSPGLLSSCYASLAHVQIGTANLSRPSKASLSGDMSLFFYYIPTSQERYMSHWDRSRCCTSSIHVVKKERLTWQQVAHSPTPVLQPLHHQSAPRASYEAHHQAQQSSS